MKVDFSKIEYPFKSGRFVDDNWETVITYGELRIFIEVVRAAKAYINCKDVAKNPEELWQEVHEALSKIEFGDKDDAKIR